MGPRMPCKCLGQIMFLWEKKDRTKRTLTRACSYLRNQVVVTGSMAISEHAGLRHKENCDVSFIEKILPLGIKRYRLLIIICSVWSRFLLSYIYLSFPK